MYCGTSGFWWKKAYKVPFNVECVTDELLLLNSFQLIILFHCISTVILNSFDFLSPESHMFYG